MVNCIQLPKEKQYLLCDYNICSSYNTGLIGNQRSDYISLDMIKKIILTGAKYIELQIVSNDYGDFPEPYIGIGEESGNWIYSLNVLELKEVFNIIKKYSFYKENNNPLIIYINFKNKKKHLIEKSGDIIYNILQDYLVNPIKYKNYPITLEKLCNLRKKIIIFTNLSESDTQGTYFEDINIPQLGFINRIYFKELQYNKDLDIDYSRNHNNKDNERFKKEYPILDDRILKNRNFYNELKDKKFLNPIKHFNKVGLTILLPHKNDDIFTKNINYEYYKELGIQIIGMNFQLYNPVPKKPTEEGSSILDKYLYYFKYSSYILKDSRFHLKNDIVLNKYIPSDKEESLNLQFINDIPMKFNNIPMAIQMYSDTDLFLSNGDGLVKFNNFMSLFMIFKSFINDEHSFIISSLKGIVPFEYGDRTFLYQTNNNDKNYVFTKKQKKLNLFNKKVTFKAVNPICIENPINVKNTTILTLVNYDKKEPRYIGQYKNKLSQYSINTNKKTKDNSCFNFIKVNYKVYLYIKYKNNNLYITSLKDGLLSLKNNKPNNNNKFEIIIGDNKDIYNDNFKFQLKYENKYLKYDENKKILNANEINLEKSSSFQFIRNINKQIIGLYDEKAKRINTYLTYNKKLNNFYFKDKTQINNTEANLLCYLEYVIH